jgi:hypothetical protein
MKTPMTSVLVFDNAPLAAKPQRSPEGFLTAVVNATRVGVMMYDGAQFGQEPGKMVRVLRLPDDVFDPASMETLKGKPLTDQHPPELLTAETAKKYMVGSTTQQVARSGDFLQTGISVFNAPTIDGIESGAIEVSCGYLADIIPGGGVHPQCGEYDFQQVNIRHNHLAVNLEAGRGGPEVKVLMDSAITPRKEKSTMKIKLGDKEYEVPSELGDALKGHLDGLTTQHQQEMDELKGKLDKLEANAKKTRDGEEGEEGEEEELEKLAEDDDDIDLEKWAKEEAAEHGDDKANKDMGHKDHIYADSLKSKSPLLRKIAEKLDTLKGQRNQLFRQTRKSNMDSIDPVKAGEAFKKRAEVVAVAYEIMDSAEADKLLSLPEAEVKKAVVLALNPKLDMTGKSGAFIDGMFEAIALSNKPSNVGEVLGRMLMPVQDGQGSAGTPQAAKPWEKKPLSAHKS